MAINISDSGTTIKVEITTVYDTKYVPQINYLNKNYFTMRSENNYVFLGDGKIEYKFLYSDVTTPSGASSDAVVLAIEVFVDNSFDREIALSAGNITNQIAINKFGINSDIDIGSEDIWGTGGTFVQPTSAGTVAIVSSSAADTSAGTGARTLTVNGLNGSYVDTTETVTLNGTTPVNTVNSYFIIHRMIVATAGSGDTNAGTITTTSNGGGTPVMASIQIGEGQTQFCIYQIPSGYTGYLKKYQGGITTGTALDLKLYAKPFGGVFNLKGNLPLQSGGSSFDVREYSTPLKFSAKTIVKLRGTATANNTACSGSFDMILIAD